MVNLNDILERELKDPKFKEEFIKEKLLFEVAVKIAKAREAKKLSQSELAKKANVTQQQVSRLETGFSSNMVTFLKVLLALGMHFDITPDGKKGKAAY